MLLSVAGKYKKPTKEVAEQLNIYKMLQQYTKTAKQYKKATEGLSDLFVDSALRSCVSNEALMVMAKQTPVFTDFALPISAEEELAQIQEEVALEIAAAPIPLPITAADAIAQCDSTLKVQLLHQFLTIDMERVKEARCVKRFERANATRAAAEVCAKAKGQKAPPKPKASGAKPAKKRSRKSASISATTSTADATPAASGAPDSSTPAATPAATAGNSGPTLVPDTIISVPAAIRPPSPTSSNLSPGTVAATKDTLMTENRTTEVPDRQLQQTTATRKPARKTKKPTHFTIPPSPPSKTTTSTGRPSKKPGFLRGFVAK